MCISSEYRGSLRKREKKRYDIVVVGGGIYGAAVAWEAVSRGLSVVLIEKGDFGEGTSANSLKVIHGGIRYLQNLDISRLRESVQERNILMRIAPHLVAPLEFVMPTYKGIKKGKLALWAGFKGYDVLAWDRNHGLKASHVIPSGSTMSWVESKAFFPVVENAAITGGARWYDGQAYNSERLVLAFVMSAREMGACVQNYMRMEEFCKRGNQVIGVRATEVLGDREHFIEGDAIIDCRGPWAGMDSTYCDLGLTFYELSPGFAMATNIAIPRQLSPVAVGARIAPSVPDERSDRLLFVVPWRHGSMVGTWYRRIGTAEPEGNAIADVEIDAIVTEANTAFPNLRLTRDDVTLVHRGRLPLADSSSEAGALRLRDRPVVMHAAEAGGPRGLFLVQGVKYTTARRVAVKVIDLVARTMAKSIRSSDSHFIPLYGGDTGSYDVFWTTQLPRLSAMFSASIAGRLLKNYGSKVLSIARYSEKDSRLAALVPGTEDVVQAELHYILDHEPIATLSDLMLRRTDIGSLSVPHAETIKFCGELMASRFGWDQNALSSNVQALFRHYPRWTLETLS